MTTNAALADVSDLTFVLAILAYAVAMFGYAAEYAFGRKPATASAERELVTAGTSGGEVSHDFTVPEPREPAETETDGTPTTVTAKQALIAGRIGFIAMLLGFTAHLGTVVLRASSAGRWPWGNMFEFIVATCLMGVAAWIYVVVRKHASRRLGVFTMLVVLLMLGSSTRVYTAAGPLVPALDSYWIAIHVFAAIISCGLFLVGFIAAVLHLIRRSYDQRAEAGKEIKFPFTLAPRLPLAQQLERLTWRMHISAFPLWTFGIMAGAIWAREAWSRYWGWDPKEVWSFVAWVVYAAYLHSRATGTVGKKIAPWIAIVGWAVILFNLFGVNLLLSGLHSYSGV